MNYYYYKAGLYRNMHNIYLINSIELTKYNCNKSWYGDFIDRKLISDKICMLLQQLKYFFHSSLCIILVYLIKKANKLK